MPPRVLVTIPLLLPLLALACGSETPLELDAPDPDLDAPRVGLVGGPQLPAIVRDVHLTDANQYTQPVIPPYRTSADGRIGVDMKPRNPDVKFYLLGPEALTEPVTAPGAPAGAQIVLERFTIPATEFYDASVYSPGDPALDPEHRTICDATPQFGLGPDVKRNPHFCDPTNPLYDDPIGSTSDQDCYDLTVITTVQHTDPVHGRMVQLWGKPLTVVVDDPRRVDPVTPRVTSIAFVDDTAPPVAGPSFHANSLLEPMVTKDGRLLVGRLGKSGRDPNDGSSRGGDKLDVVYGTYSETAAPCDVTQWTTLHPISHAHHDPEMQGRYGIAEYPLRDPHGVEIPDGVDAQVSYPWIDRDGDNLMFTTLDATLFNDDGSGGLMQRYGASCYDAGCTLPTTVAEADAFENQENFRGFGFAGLWSHGKMVLFDNALNNTDYGFGREDDEQVLLDLYDDPVAGSIRVGTGRDNGNPVPAMSTANSAFIDSLEHLFNFDDDLLPLTVRDVVWIVNSGKVSAEVAFDDYLDPNALIVAEMSGALEHTGAGGVRMRYHDGFHQTAPGTVVAQGTSHLRFQNAATSLAWDVPAYGVAHGDVRLEPVALGGIEGRGAWLDGTDDAISFTISDLTRAEAEQRAWYVGLFVDARFDDAQRRQLVVFPDGSQIVLVGRSTIEYVDSTGTTTETIALGDLALPHGGWSHLGFVLNYTTGKTRLYVDGFAYAKTNAVVHHIESGELTLGDAPGDALPGFVGWVDELKVLAHAPSPELACNHARGTLMGGTAAVAPHWKALARDYPNWAHDRISNRLTADGYVPFAKYVCHHDYAEPLAANPRLPGTDSALTSVRDWLLFPEGPLEFQLERPDSTGNAFCLTCHTPTGAPGLDLNALTPGDPGRELENDLRRQPMMPPRMTFGNIPAMVFGTGPAIDISVGSHLLDRYAFPN